jgi:phosphatidate cytidylyltransferase
VLRWRLLITAAILVPLLSVLVLDATWNFGIPGLWLVPLGWLLALAATSEMLDLLGDLPERPVAWSVLAGVSLLYLAGCAPALRLLLSGEDLGAAGDLLAWPLFALAAGVMLVFVAEMLRYERPGRAVLKVAVGVFVLVYPGLMLAMIARLRFVHGNAWGMVALISLVLIAKMSDTGAYTFGKLFGRHKMSPLLSPGKTVEGAIGGLLVGAVTAWAFFQWIAPAITGEPSSAAPWWGCWVYGVVIASVGIVGDLSESLLKRDLRKKDSSSWLPGLGGVLDVLDSVLMAAPAALLCWYGGIVGP